MHVKFKNKEEEIIIHVETGQASISLTQMESTDHILEEWNWGESEWT